MLELSIGNIITLLVLGFNVAMFIVIKFNDMHHIAADVKEIKENLKTLVEKETLLDKALCEVVARCEERHTK